LCSSRSNPSPVPLRLMKAPTAGHPLPKGEGCGSRWGSGVAQTCRGLACLGHVLVEIRAKGAYIPTKSVGTYAPPMVRGPRLFAWARGRRGNPGGCPRLDNGRAQGPPLQALKEEFHGHLANARRVGAGHKAEGRIVADLALRPPTQST